MPYFEVQLTKKLQRVYDVHADMVIGRAPQCQIQLLSRAVSRRHARIEFDGQAAIISDLGTKNGIKLNGQRVQGAAVVSDGDQVLVGDIKMIFRAATRGVQATDAIDLRSRQPTQQDLSVAFQPRSSFLILADPNSINAFQSQIARARIAALDFDEITQFKLQIALKEAIENARIHGSGSDPSRSIQVTFNEDQDEFVMIIRDEGPGYAVESVLEGAQEVDALEAIRTRTPAQGPMGLRIILNCVDRIQFGGQGNTVYLGRYKAEGQLLVISEDAGEYEEEPSDWVNPSASPFQQPGSSEEGPLKLGDLFD